MKARDAAMIVLFRIIDPLLSYQNCQFEYGPQYVEGTGNYKVRSTTGEEDERSMTGSAVVARLQRKGKERLREGEDRRAPGPRHLPSQMPRPCRPPPPRCRL